MTIVCYEKEKGMIITKSGKKLEQVIKKAMEDLVITAAEHEEIFTLALEDGRLDDHEKVLLKEFINLLENKTITQAP